jgi:hypothetical protein
MSYIMENDEKEPTVYIVEIEKAKREGLIPVRRAVERGGKTYQQTFWVKPKDLRQMNTKNAVAFMEGMVKTQQYFKQALEKSENALPDAAAAVYDKMMKSGKLMQKIGGLQLKIADFQRNNPVSGDNLLAAIHSRPESEIPDKVKGLVNKLYQKVTTTNFGKQLELGRKTGAVSSVRVETKTKPATLDKKTWTTKFKDIMTRKIAEVKSIFSARKKGTEVIKPAKKDGKQSKQAIEVKSKEVKYEKTGDLKSTFGVQKKVVEKEPKKKKRVKKSEEQFFVISK